MSVEILHPGTHATVQDLGRPNARGGGVPLGGAVDRNAHTIANWIVGNDANAATIEMYLVGPKLRVHREARVALYGSDTAGVTSGTPIRVRKGDVIDLARMTRAYGYLAIAGGIDVQGSIGSRSTDTRLGIGGFEGRALRKGDVLNVLPSSSRLGSEPWFVRWGQTEDPSPIRVLRGEQWEEFDGLTSEPFVIASRSDRMGIRLTGSTILRRGNLELPSRPVAPGTIQIPPDGAPIVLLADAQTLGGYPKIAHVISVDLPRLAQRRPDSRVEFQTISLEQAHELQRSRARELAMLQQGIRLKYT